MTGTWAGGSALEPEAGGPLAVDASLASSAGLTSHPAFREGALNRPESRPGTDRLGTASARAPSYRQMRRVAFGDRRRETRNPALVRARRTNRWRVDIRGPTWQNSGL